RKPIAKAPAMTSSAAGIAPEPKDFRTAAAFTATVRTTRSTRDALEAMPVGRHSRAAQVGRSALRPRAKPSGRNMVRRSGVAIDTALADPPGQKSGTTIGI